MERYITDRTGYSLAVLLLLQQAPEYTALLKRQKQTASARINIQFILSDIPGNAFGRLHALKSLIQQICR